MWKYFYPVSSLPFNFIVGLHDLFLLPNNSPSSLSLPLKALSSMGWHITQPDQSKQSILLTAVIGSGMAKWPKSDQWDDILKLWLEPMKKDCSSSIMVTNLEGCLQLIATSPPQGNKSGTEESRGTKRIEHCLVILFKHLNVVVPETWKVPRVFSSVS